MSYYRPKCCAVVSFMYSGNEKTAVSFFVKSATVTRNMYKEAGKFSIVADYQYFPFDPRIVLSPLMSIHIDDADPETDFTPGEENLVFLGYIDSIEADAGRGEVKFDGIDYTGLFLNSKAQFTLPSIGQKITQIFSQVKDLIPAANKIKIFYKAAIAEPLVSQSLNDISNTSNLGAHVEKDANAWDFMQSVALSVGLICYLDFDTIVIDDPTHFRTDLEDSAYCFGYPFNTENITMERKHGKYNSLQVELRSTQGKSVIAAKYPENPIQSYHLSARQKNESVQNALSVVEHKINKVVQTVGVNTNINTLKIMAERVYKELQSYQSVVRIKTRDMLVFTKESQRNNEKLSIFNMKIGQNVNIVNFWDNYANGEVLQKKGWPSQVANSLVSLQEKSSRLFYISKITFNFSNNSGISTSIEGLSRLKLDGQPEPNIM